MSFSKTNEYLLQQNSIFYYFYLDELILCDDNCSSCCEGSDEVKVCGELIFCIKCEKKIKFPVEICVLTTGFCKEPEVDFGRCEPDDFPDLFPVRYPEEGFPYLFEEEEKIQVIEEPYEEIVDIEDFED